MLFSNDCASLTLHRTSLKGTVQDFIISFNENQTDIQQVLHLTLDLFQKLVSLFADRLIYARLVAKVRFIHINNITNEMDERFYHFASYSCEKVNDIDEFFQRHMTKIASRLDQFNVNGSNLLMKNIDHIHVLLTVT